MKKFFLFVFLSTVVLFAGCQVFPEEITQVDEGYQRVAPEELEAILAAEDILLINVRDDLDENIPGTDFTLHYDQVKDNQDLLPKDKDTRIILYCVAGGTSRKAAEAFVDLGYTNISDLAGGIGAWKDAGLPVELKE
ncbi:MAG: rhodanese-like domain-containing protein [Anaerolineaceae bacterium]|nr:rhodanese-like domain-containing protein [Anaerolineaceae bacterium]